MSTNDSPAVDSAKEIARRIIRRHNAKHAAQLNAAALRIAALEASLATAQTTLGEQSAELTDAGEAVALLQARVAELERERDAALADMRYHEKCFTQMIGAMRAASSGDYDHLIPALRRLEQTNARGNS